MSPTDPAFPRGTHAGPVALCAHSCGKTPERHSDLSLDGGPLIGHTFVEPRDLDQEAKDREEMIGLLLEHDIGCPQRSNPCGECRLCRTTALLKRMGRLP